MPKNIWQAVAPYPLTCSELLQYSSIWIFLADWMTFIKVGFSFHWLHQESFPIFVGDFALFGENGSSLHKRVHNYYCEMKLFWFPDVVAINGTEDKLFYRAVWDSKKVKRDGRFFGFLQLMTNWYTYLVLDITSDSYIKWILRYRVSLICTVVWIGAGEEGGNPLRTA